MSFEETPNFNYMKGLVISAAEDANLDIFDNVFDWSILLTNQKKASCLNLGKFNPYLNANGARRIQSGSMKRSQVASQNSEELKEKNILYA
jgi:topoisomerase IA-like protein